MLNNQNGFNKRENIKTKFKLQKNINFYLKKKKYSKKIIYNNKKNISY